jgi:hypothetical protein
MDRALPPSPAPAAACRPAPAFEVDRLPPWLYRSEGFAEDLCDPDEPVGAERCGRPGGGRLPLWLTVAPLGLALAGALATALAPLA